MKKNLLKSVLVAGLLAVSAGANAQVYAETDLTNQFMSLTKPENWTGATGYVTWAAPEVELNNGTKIAACERYDGNCTNTGNVFKSTVKNLAPGTYKIELYGAAAFTFGRGFGSTAFTGDLSVDSNSEYQENDMIMQNTGVVLYAKTSGGEYGGEIPICYATNFNTTGIAVVEMEGIVVGEDGEMEIGMDKSSTSTNWHVIQLKGVTAQVDVLALLQNEINAAQALKEQWANIESDAHNTLANAIRSAESMLSSTDPDALVEAANTLKAAEEQFLVDLRYHDFEGVAYIIDVESGLMIAAGHDWGTRGIVNEMGLDMTFILNDDNTYNIDSQVSNGGDSHFLGSNLYTDSDAFGWSLYYVGFGFYISNGSQYISLDYENNLVLSDTPHEWVIVTAEGIREQRLGEMELATADNPADATFLLKNPNFNRNDLRVSAWEVSEDCTNKNLNGGNNLNNCAESYHSTFTISQTIEDAPAGTYQMIAQGFYRQDMGKESVTEYDPETGEEKTTQQDVEITEDAPYFFIGDATGYVPVRTGEEDNMSQASESFTAGLYTIEPITFTHNGGSLTVGIAGSALYQWVIFDNFQLKYLGTTADGISEVNAAAKQQQGVVYNLQGQRVQKAQKGINIIDGKKMFVK